MHQLLFFFAKRKTIKEREICFPLAIGTRGVVLLSPVDGPAGWLGCSLRWAELSAPPGQSGSAICGQLRPWAKGPLYALPAGCAALSTEG